MATEILARVYADGTGDYTSLRAAVIAEAADLVAIDSYIVFELKGDLRNTDAFVDFGPYTTDATRNVIIRPVASDYTDGIAGNTGTIYSVSTFAIVCRSEHITIDGLDFSGWSSQFFESTNLSITNSLLYNGSSNIDQAHRVENTIIYDVPNQSLSRVTSEVKNVTIINKTSQSATTDVLFNSITGVITRSAALNENASSTEYSLSSNLSNDLNASSDSTAPGATTYTTTPADFVDFANDNYNIDPTSPLYTANVGAVLTPIGSGITLEVDSGTYNLTGTGISLKAAFKSAIDSGSYNLSGTATNLIVDRKVIAESGAYSLTGSNTDLIAARKSIIESGSYNLTGSSVDLIYTPTGGGEVLVADSGSFALGGADVGLIVNRRTAIEPGNYNLTGQSIQLTYNSNIVADSGTYALTGQDISLFASYVTIATSGNYDLTGYPVTLRYSGDTNQTIGTVTTSFADDKFTASYKPNSITVTFKA